MSALPPKADVNGHGDGRPLLTQSGRLGCLLSPLIGAFILNVLDRRMESSGLLYVRFMDDTSANTLEAAARNQNDQRDARVIALG